MTPEELEKNLKEWSAKNSGHDIHRNYIGLSTISECQRLIYYRFFNEVNISVEARLKNRDAYEREESIKERLRGMGLYKPGKEISLFGGLVQGHTDGEIIEDLLEIKTVPLDSHFPRDGRIPTKAYWQTQAYLKYGHYKFSFIIYYAKQNGALCVVGISPNNFIAEKIEAKIERLVEAVRKKEIPICECGRCR
jgi:hypothetical protein